MSNCEEIGDCSDSRMQKICAYMDGQLSRTELDLVKKHIDNCEDCTKECDVETIIRDALKRSCAEKAPESLKDKLKAKLQTAN